MTDGGLRSLYTRHLPSVHWVAVESGSMGTGTPDTNFCHDGVEGWIENKMTHGWVVAIRPTQLGWIARRLNHGGRVFVAIHQIRDLSDGRRQALWLFGGRWASALASGGIRPLMDCAVIHCEGAPSSWSWLKIREALCHYALS